jgi:SulP family sulfate permease
MLTMATKRVRERSEETVESLLPVTKWLPRYDRSWLRLDVVAGITVVASVIPEGMAYASLANLPPETGLYAGLLAVVVYFFLGMSRQLIFGPTSALAILLASAVGSVATGSPAAYPALVALTTVMVGTIAVVAWLFRLGFFVNFISGSVITGFSAGAALYIMSTQLGKLFAIEGSSGQFFDRLWYIGTHLGQANLATVAVGVAGIVLLLVGEHYLPRAPNALVVVLLSIVFVTVTDVASRGVEVVGHIPSGLPSFAVPSGVTLAQVEVLLPVAFALFILSYVQGIGAAETFARRHDYQIDPNQELLANGAANLAAGFGGGFAVGGSFSRSALDDSVGGRTQVASAVIAVVLVVVLLFLTGIFTNLPEATLAAVVIVAVRSLIDEHALRRLYRVSRSEFAVAAAALLGVLVFGMLWGVFLGVTLSLLIIIARISLPQTEVLGRVPQTDHFANRAHFKDVVEEPDVFVYRVDAQLFYANARTVQDDITDAIQSLDRKVELVVFDLASSPSVDLEAAQMLDDLHARLQSQGIDLRLAGANSEVRDLIVADGLDDKVGPVSEDEPIASVIDTWKKDRQGSESS